MRKIIKIPKILKARDRPFEILRIFKDFKDFSNFKWAVLLPKIFNFKELNGLFKI